MSHAIQTRALVKSYEVGFLRKKLVRALRGVDLAVEPGQIYGLLGPNGAGKSTIIKLLLNLLHPTSGDVLVFGQAPREVSARKLIGYLPENPAPYEYLTGREFVTYAGTLAGLSGGELKRRVGEVIDMTGMGTAAQLQVRRYSKGMTQRICLAQSLVSQPKLLVLDEPTSGLDVLGRKLVRDIILKQRELGTTVLLCSHIIPDVEALCDHVAVIVGGQIIKQGSVSSLLTTDATHVELQVERVSDETLASLGAAITEKKKAGERWLLRCPEAECGQVLRALVAADARVLELQRSRYSLEELFIAALKDSGKGIGSDIQ